MKIGFFLAVAGLSLAGLSAEAQSRTLTCNIDIDRTGWVGGTYRLSHERGSERVTVSDEIILHFYDEPIQADLSEDTDKKSVYVWEVQARDARGQLTRMAYRLAIFKTKMNATLRAKPLGYRNDFSRRGQCKWEQ